MAAGDNAGAAAAAGAAVGLAPEDIHSGLLPADKLTLVGIHPVENIEMHGEHCASSHGLGLPLYAGDGAASAIDAVLR